ncbi:ADP-ribosylation factor 1-like 1 [Calliphora vicina]|uniref:ADP-ribosylation factor 1-like 1 n=1 Tax=Calliphora vicina TaxID=7373 RepID=UPI00325A8186
MDMTLDLLGEYASPQPNVAILMVGLPESGKTTLLNKLISNDCDVTTIPPTNGFKRETIKFEEKYYIFWDIGGFESLRFLWEYYIPNKDAVVFVVDASNLEVFAMAKEFLHIIMSHDNLNGVQLLVVFNKQDKTNCATDEDLEQQLDLKSLKQSYRIVRSSAFDRESLKNIMVHLRDMNLF